MSPYGFFVATGGVEAILWLEARRCAIGLTENEFWAALWTITIAGIVGAKSLFLILGWRHYQSGELQFWRDFRTEFMFFGGLIGAFFAGVRFARIRGLSFRRGADYFAVALPLGHAIGRVGCYWTGCCSGRGPHPVQLYESVGLLAIAAGAFAILHRSEAGRFHRGASFCFYLVSYGLLRFALEPLRADGLPERLFGFSHQQNTALGLLCLGAGSAIAIRVHRRCHESQWSKRFFTPGVRRPRL